MTALTSYDIHILKNTKTYKVYNPWPTSDNLTKREKLKIVASHEEKTQRAIQMAKDEGKKVVEIDNGDSYQGVFSFLVEYPSQALIFKLQALGMIVAAKRPKLYS